MQGKVKQKALETLLVRMFKFAGVKLTFKQILDLSKTDPNWFSTSTMTERQSKEWQAWGVKYLSKALKISQKIAKTEMAYVNLQWGLRIREG